MSRSEFRFNRKRKHYSYLFKDIGIYRKNILISTKPKRKWHNKVKINVRLYKHPNPNSKKEVFIIPKIYVDHLEAFDKQILKWKFDKNDKRKVKRIKKQNKTG